MEPDLADTAPASDPALAARSSQQTPRRRHVAGVRCALIVSVVALIASLVSCHHLVTPVYPRRLPDDDAALLEVDPRRTVRLVNGYRDREVIWFRSEGLHHLGADLREWTDRLLTQLQIELEPRGVSAVIDVVGAETATDAALRIAITQVVPPGAGGGGGALVTARIASVDGDYEAEFSSGATSHGFADALYNLKAAILADPHLAGWLRATPTPQSRPEQSL